MSKPLKAIIYLGTEGIQNTQVYSGLGLLQHAGILTLQFKKARNGGSGKIPVECIIEDKKIAFELHDRAGYLDKDTYDWCDFYFKRSATAEVLEKNHKMLPWGLNFVVTSHYDFALQRALYNFTARKFFERYFVSNIVLSKLFKVKNGAYSSNWKRLQQPPVKSTHPLVTFSARLWDPGKNLDEYKRDDRHRINEERAGFVRALKQHFPNNYKGGIEDTPFARTFCPDIILPVNNTNSASYILTLKESSIGIATPGLVGSVGWKFSEYLLFSKAIVANDISQTVLPVPPQKEVNYLPYTSTDTMLAAVERLVRDEGLRFTMMDNNYQYAQNNMLPHKQMANALNRIGFNITL